MKTVLFCELETEFLNIILRTFVLQKLVNILFLLGIYKYDLWHYCEVDVFEFGNLTGWLSVVSLKYINFKSEFISVIN